MVHTIAWSTALDDIHGTEQAATLWDEVATLLVRHTRASPKPGPHWDETNAWLITYPDHFRRPSEPPLRTLRGFYVDRLEATTNGVHSLPFFPSTSDEGFSIGNYTAFHPALRTWDDITAITSDARLMVDAVLNHCSTHSEWFHRRQASDPEYADSSGLPTPTPTSRPWSALESTCSSNR